MGTYIVQADLEKALSPRTVLAIFQDDPAIGTADNDAVEAVIDRAEAQVDSALLGFVPMPLANPLDRLVKAVALEFAIAYSFERHPEYVRAFGESQRQNKIDRAELMLARIQQALRRLPDNNTAATVGAGGTTYNVGGIVTASGPRTMVDSPDGTQNSGDF